MFLFIDMDDFKQYRANSEYADCYMHTMNVDVLLTASENLFQVM